MHHFLILTLLLITTGCTGLPDNLHPVKPFDAKRYLGKWYEIARLDHSFERGLNNVTAEYLLLEDSGIKVINKGYSISDKQWKNAEGKAYFVREADEGYLKVSFFGPFYGSYVIFELDQENYEYAFVAGPDRSYLWLLSRTPKIDNELMDAFITTSKDHGFDTEKLIIIEHDRINR